MSIQSVSSQHGGFVSFQSRDGNNLKNAHFYGIKNMHNWL